MQNEEMLFSTHPFDIEPIIFPHGCAYRLYFLLRRMSRKLEEDDGYSAAPPKPIRLSVTDHDAAVQTGPNFGLAQTDFVVREYMFRRMRQPGGPSPDNPFGLQKWP